MQQVGLGAVAVGHHMPTDVAGHRDIETPGNVNDFRFKVQITF